MHLTHIPPTHVSGSGGATQASPGAVSPPQRGLGGTLLSAGTSRGKVPEGFDITGLSEARSVERFQALHPDMQENIKKLPLVAKHGLAPEAVFATMRHDAADRFGGDLDTAYTRYMMNAMGLRGPAVVRKKLPTNPGLPSVPKLDIPTAATNAGVRGVG